MNQDVLFLLWIAAISMNLRYYIK